VLPALRGRPGYDPRGWLGGDRAPARELFCELEAEGGRVDVRRHSRALIRLPDKLVIARAPEQLGLLVPDPDNPAYALAGPLYYDLAADPGEQHPRPPDAVPPGPSLVAALEERRAGTGPRAAPAPTAGLDAATREQLRALGYNR
jgi:hypothetical protein